MGSTAVGKGANHFFDRLGRRWLGGAEIASTGKCKYGKVKYKTAKRVQVENTSTEYSSTGGQGWKMQVRKNRVRNNNSVTGNTTEMTLPSQFLCVCRILTGSYAVQHGSCAEVEYK